MEIEVYCDGSGNTFDSDGGWAFCVLRDGELIAEGSGYLQSATNNTAEIKAAISGLSFVANMGHNDGERNVKLISDSQLVIGYATGRYACKALHLTQLYIELRELFQQLNATAQWVKGHSGNPNNERCDKLAKAAREGKGR
jgi:ribonuclease HI